LLVVAAGAKAAEEDPPASVQSRANKAAREIMVMVARFFVMI
jgi:hypothetical protein